MTSRPTIRGKLPALDWSDWSTRFAFFTGKGGVGKTTVAAAAALALADRGRRVLVVSTDPASNLDDVLATSVSTESRPVPGADSLSAMNIDPEAAASAYRERVIGPYRGAVPAEELRALEEQLAGQCTVEIAAFDEFSRLLAQPELTESFDHVFFDTAPTGHTLRLLSLPSAWSGYIATSAAGASCLGPASGLETRREQYEQTVAALFDAALTTIVLVSRAERSTLAEAARAGVELAALGIANQRLVVNAVLTDPLAGDPVAEDIALRQRDALADLPLGLAALPAASVPLVASDLTGLAALRAFTAGADALRADPATTGAGASTPLPPLDSLIDELSATGHGAVLVMGKGGVGKTAIAAKIALALARRGHSVHLSTTDPAGDPAAVIGAAAPENLSVGRIDPRVEVQRYTERKLAGARDLDVDARALLAEDLRSPCTEEIAVFAGFARLLGEARDRFVVLDTAPTGHTLLLLDTAGAYHRDVIRTSRSPGRMTTPLMRLQDPSQTRILIVTLAEATPVHEAAELQDDLRRAGIEPYGWIVNATLSGSGTRDPLLLRRAALEERHLRRIRNDLSTRAWNLTWRTSAEDLPRLESDAEVAAPTPACARALAETMTRSGRKP